ncbi:MAG: SLC13 family permease, partial [Vibrio sp.]
IDFLTWMAFGLPFVMIQLFLGWVIVRKLFHVNPAPIKLQLSGEFEKSFKAKLVYFTFGLTILLWLTTALHGMNSYVIAVIPVAVFTIAGIIGKEELKQINWDVLFLVAGGIAIGHALDVTGLADLIAHAIDYNRLSSFGVIAALCVLCWLMANFMSNTATANLIIPIALAISTSMQSLSETYGIQGVLVMVAFAASLGMVLPISTPPNSLAYSTGFITTKDMAKVGVILGVIGLGLIFIASTLI